MKKKIFDLLESNQLNPFDLLELQIEIFENVKKDSQNGLNESFEKASDKICEILRCYENILIDPILKQIGYLEFGNLKKSMDNFLKNESKSSIENLDIRFDVLKLEIKLNTLALNAKVLLSSDYINVKNCDIQTKFFKMNLR